MKMYFSHCGQTSREDPAGPGGPPLVGSVLIGGPRYQQSIVGIVALAAHVLRSTGRTAWFCGPNVIKTAGQSLTPLPRVNGMQT